MFLILGHFDVFATTMRIRTQIAIYETALQIALFSHHENHSR